MGYSLLAKEVRSEKWELRSKKLKVKREKEKEIYCKMKNEKDGYWLLATRYW